jgi:hypothetical protein
VADADPDGHVWTRGVTLADNETLLDGVNKHRDGYLTCEARVARTGLQKYRGYELGMPQQEHVILYRPAEEVFTRDAMRSMANKPITLTHPREMVDAKSWSKVAKGFSGSEVMRDGEYVRIPLMLTDAAAIEAFESGKARELSVGYTTDVDWTPGVTADGDSYDGVQRAIRGNHHALVPVARGGDQLRFGDSDDEPAADIELIDREFTAESRKKGAEAGWAKPDGSYPIRNTGDLKNAISAWGRGGATASDKAWIKKRAKALGATSMLPENWQTDADPSGGADLEEKAMAIVRTFDGIPISFADEVSAAAMEREMRKLADQAENFKGKQAKPFGKNGNGNGGDDNDDDDTEAKRKKVAAEDGLRKEIAAKDGEIAVLKKQLTDAKLTDAQVEAMAAERISVIDAAKPLLPKDFNPAGKSLSEIRRAAVAVSFSDAEIKDWDDAKLTGAFLALTKTGSASGGAKALADGMTRAFSGHPDFRGHSQGQLSDAEKDADKAHDEYVQRLKDGYKQPLSVVRN